MLVLVLDKLIVVVDCIVYRESYLEDLNEKFFFVYYRNDFWYIFRYIK